MGFLKFPVSVFSAVSLLISSALAQVPGASPAPEVFYALEFHKALSGPMISGEAAFNFDPQRTVAIDNCTVTVLDDGAVHCFTGSSCPEDAGLFPFCALFFTGPPGLELPNVVSLSELSEGSPVVNRSSSEMGKLSLQGNANDAVLIYKALKKRQ